ncbi:MAG: hypothetical protein WC471_04215 [Candidatus Woesearchaeota archaeon]|jgi:hypothetical protein
MATFLDIGILKYVQVLFPFILVWAVTYSALQWREVLGKNQSLHSIIALVVALLTVLSPQATAVIQYMSPWFAMMLIFAMFFLIFLKFFGVSEGAITRAFETSDDARFLTYWILVISIIILAGAIGKVFFGGSSVYVGSSGTVLPIITPSTAANYTDEYGVATASGEVNFAATIFHPKVLGMLLVLIIAAFTIKLLAGDVILPKK